MAIEFAIAVLFGVALLVNRQRHERYRRDVETAWANGIHWHDIRNYPLERLPTLADAQLDQLYRDLYATADQPVEWFADGRRLTQFDAPEFVALRGQVGMELARRHSSS